MCGPIFELVVTELLGAEADEFGRNGSVHGEVVDAAAACSAHRIVRIDIDVVGSGGIWLGGDHLGSGADPDRVL